MIEKQRLQYRKHIVFIRPFGTKYSMGFLAG